MTEYKPRTHPDVRNHHVNAGYVIEDLAHAEACLKERDVEIERLRKFLASTGKTYDSVEDMQKARNETTEEDFMPKVNGKSFRCVCECNVFRKLIADPSVYVCNGCKAHWRGE